MVRLNISEWGMGLARATRVLVDENALRDSNSIMSTNASEALGTRRYTDVARLIQQCRDNSVACESKFEPQPDLLSTDNERTMLLC
ncbi:hypothetical protein QJS10_CPA07g00996 [Acorus calamus]|uniref:Uncharacterized protein n=1 Tax=Acorus calamus TaxID=4465 RepID=A0AAV9EGG9_ACOCL|nr:hypothetical protein QJS10_CPA07g00996 [Acorus calamus]